MKEPKMVLRKLLCDEKTTLGLATGWVRDNLPQGCICPCCAQIAKMYKRALNAPMVVALALIYQAALDRAKVIGVEATQVSVYVPAFSDNPKTAKVIRSRHYPKLAYWGLLAPVLAEDGSQTAGVWRVPPKGVDFLNRKIKVPKYAFVYNQQCHGFGGAMVDLDDAYEEPFDLDMVLKG